MCTHVGPVVSGAAIAAFEDGTVPGLTPGTLLQIPPTARDSWMIGGAHFVSLHFLGADRYAK